MTLITPGHVRAFQMIRSPLYDNITLSGCRINGEGGVAIIVMDEIRDNQVAVMPLFVSITPRMKLKFPNEQSDKQQFDTPTEAFTAVKGGAR